MNSLRQSQRQKLKLSAKQILQANLLQLNAQLLEQRILREISDNPVLELSEEESLNEDSEDSEEQDILEENDSLSLYGVI